MATLTAYAQFVHTHLGAEYEVEAKFSRGAENATFDSPYEADWSIDEIEITGPDGEDWSSEMQSFFSIYIPKVGSPKNVSVYDSICEKSYEEMEYE